MYNVQIFNDATEFFLRAHPNLAAVIPAMDHIEETLNAYALDDTKPHAIRVAVALAKKTLNRYYESTDSSEVYRIAMSTLT